MDGAAREQALPAAPSTVASAPADAPVYVAGADVAGADVAGCYRLLRAVLDDAAACLRGMARARQQKAARCETRAWVLSGERGRLFAFETVCDVLELDVAAERKRLLSVVQRTRRAPKEMLVPVLRHLLTLDRPATTEELAAAIDRPCCDVERMLVQHVRVQTPRVAQVEGGWVPTDAARTATALRSSRIPPKRPVQPESHAERCAEVVRAQGPMSLRDLARLLGVKPKRLRSTLSRHIRTVRQPAIARLAIGVYGLPAPHQEAAA